MEIKHRIYNNILYVMLCGELDENSANFTKTKLDELMDCFGFSQIIIDLSELEFMDSTGVGVMIGRYKKMKERNIPIYICNANKNAEKIFTMTGLYNIMPKIN